MQSLKMPIALEKWCKKKNGAFIETRR